MEPTIDAPKTTQAQVPEDRALVFANEVLNPVAPYGKLDALKEMSRRIGFTCNDPHGITVMEAVHIAQMAIATQANPFNGELSYWVDIKNNERKLTLHWGRTYWVRLADEYAEDHETKFNYEFLKVLKPEEKTRYGAEDDDTVYRVIIRDKKEIDEYVNQAERLTAISYDKDEIRATLGAPPILEGLGIVSAQEKNGPLRYSASKYPHDERCMKRALMNGLKKKVTFSTPQIAADFAGYIKEDWSPTKGDRQIVDALFVPVEDETSTTVSDEIPPEFEELAKEWEAMQAVGDSKNYTQEELAARRKVAYWPEWLLEEAVKQNLGENSYRIAAVLAYSPFVFPGQSAKNPKKKNGGLQEWKWIENFNLVRDAIDKNFGIIANMQETADYASGLTFGLKKSIDEVLADFDARNQFDESAPEG